MFEDIPEGGFTTEAAWWDYFNDAADGMRRLAQWEETFGNSTISPAEQEECLRATAWSLAKDIQKGQLRPLFTTWMYQHLQPYHAWAPHPEALKLLATFGVFYRPSAELSRWNREPEAGECYRNARAYLKERNSEECGDEFVYVEGLVHGRVCLPMAHAWNVRGLKSTNVLDWTFYATTRWCWYLGISLTVAELEEIEKQTGRWGSLFTNNNYCGWIADFIRERRPQQAQAA